jgi:hypothetical protein
LHRPPFNCFCNMIDTIAQVEEALQRLSSDLAGHNRLMRSGVDSSQEGLLSELEDQLRACETDVQYVESSLQRKRDELSDVCPMA